MAQEVFIGDPDGRALRDGKYLYAATDEDIKPGMLVYILNGHNVFHADAASVPDGVAYGGRPAVYRPTSKTFADEEEMVVLRGDFLAYYSCDFFIGSALPAFAATIYSAAGGLMNTSGTNKVGKVTRTFARIEEVGGVGVSQNLVEVLFEIGKP